MSTAARDAPGATPPPPPATTRRAAFFDLDHTLVRVNTASMYMRSLVDRGEARRRDLAYLAFWVVQYSLGVLDIESLAGRAVRSLRGRDEAQFREAMRAWVRSDVMRHLTDTARREVARRHAEGYVCAVLTSSTPYAAEPLAAELGIEHVLASRLEVADGCFTGEYVKPLCYGAGKVATAEAWAREHHVAIAQSVFYTDSISDLPMLERVGEPVVVNPDPRLRLTALRRGWRVERW